MIESNEPSQTLAVTDGLPAAFWADEGIAAGREVPAPAAREDPADEEDARTGLVSLSFIGAAIRRRKLLWSLAALVGLLAGSVLLLTTHPTYQVTVSVLMSNDPSIDQPTAMGTDVLLTQEPTFAALVMRKLGLNEPVTTFLKAYTVTQVSNDVLSLTANDPTAAGATNLADTLATQYLSFRGGLLREQLKEMIAAYDTQVSAAQQNARTLADEVSKASAQPASAAQQRTLKNLKAKSDAAANLATSLQQSVSYSQAQTQVAVTKMITGSNILSTTTPTLAHSRKKAALEYVVGGAFGGLVVGFGIAAIGAVISERLRRRDDVAAALGVPVRLSVETLPAGGRRARPSGRRGADAQRILAYLRHSIPGDNARSRSLAVIAVDNEAFVASLVAELVTACARDGLRVLAADLSGGALASRLGPTTPGVHMVEAGQERVALVVPEPDDLAPAGPRYGQAADGIAAAYSASNVLIALARLDPAVAADHLGGWADDAVVVVTAGTSTGVRLHAAGEMIRNAGVRTVSAVLVGADKDDESLGAVSARA